MTGTITLTHGAGGRQMHDLIKNLILSELGNPLLEKMDDSAVLPCGGSSRMAMTTDSYVVSPLFFSGGDIGRLAVCGTVNDLATSGAVPAYLSLAFILEEGFPLTELSGIIRSIKETAAEAEVQIVTGDIKVVEKGKGDGIYINTCGVGFISPHLNISSANALPGDLVAVTGPVGNHEAALLLERGILNFDASLESDAAPLNKPLKQLLESAEGIHTVKDPTRGGLASALVEIASNSSCLLEIDEESIPVDSNVRAVCELAGLDPLYLANEGKYIIVMTPGTENYLFRSFPRSAIIGKVKDRCEKGKVLMNTAAGGVRRITMLETAQLPRIC